MTLYVPMVFNAWEKMTAKFGSVHIPIDCSNGSVGCILCFPTRELAQAAYPGKQILTLQTTEEKS